MVESKFSIILYFKNLFFFDKTIYYNIFYSSIFKILSKIFYLILFIFIVRTFSSENLGLYTFLWSFGSFYLLFITFGKSYYLLRRYSYNIDHLSKEFLSIIKLKFYLILVFSILFLIIYKYLFSGISIYYILLIFSISIVETFSSYMNILFEVHEQFKISNFIELVHDIAIVALSFIFLFNSHKLIYIFVSFFLVKCLRLLYLIWHFRRDLNSFFLYRVPINYLFILNSSFPFLLTDVIGMLLYRFDILLLYYYNFISDIAYYEVGYVIITNMFALSFLLIWCLFPRFSKLFSENLFTKLSILFLKYGKLFLSLNILILIFFTIFGKFIIVLLYSSKYAASYPLFLILLFASFFANLVSYFSNFLIAINKLWKNILVISIGSIMNILLNIIFIPKYTVYAAAWTTFFSYIFIALAQFILIKSFFRKHLVKI